ncbi:hypothetical protein C8J55DRAFT_411928, partial [Lentinula edodes]
LRESDLPHRTKLGEIILREFEKEWNQLSKEMKKSLGRIALTLDMWSNGALKGFMAVTGHYMVR